MRYLPLGGAGRVSMLLTVCNFLSRGFESIEKGMLSEAVLGEAVDRNCLQGICHSYLEGNPLW